MNAEKLISNKQVEINGFGSCWIESWAPDQTLALILYKELEQPNWAPWLAADPQTLVGRALVFPDGQMVIKKEDGLPIASLSTNRITWNGNIDFLPSWDQVAGDPTTYENTYKDDGNAIVLMSMNVSKSAQKTGLAQLLIAEIKGRTKILGIEYIIGSFRPNQYGEYKLSYGDPGFAEYCNMKREDGLPYDAWLRSLSRNGMKPLKIDEKAMVVEMPLNEFHQLIETYKPDLWKKIGPNSFECGEVGKWQMNEQTGSANYVESNLWGIL